MKRLTTAFILSFFAFFVQAKDLSQMTNDELIAERVRLQQEIFNEELRMCHARAMIAGKIMEAHHQRLPFAEIYAAVKRSNMGQEHLVRAAYSEPRLTKQLLIKARVDSFRDAEYVRCVRSIKS